jgi:hypothetical protein
MTTSDSTNTTPRPVAHWAYFEADPESRPPFLVRIGLTRGQDLDELWLEDCQNIPAAAERVMQALIEHNLLKSPRFYFIYPRYAVEDELETKVIYIANLVFGEAEQYGVGFERNILPLVASDISEAVESRK